MYLENMNAYFVSPTRDGRTVSFTLALYVKYYNCESIAQFMFINIVQVLLLLLHSVL